MKITGTMSSITFDLEDGHVVKAKGEMLMNNTFAVDRGTMTHWEPPFEDEPFTKEAKEKLIQDALKQVSANTVQLIFD